MTDVYFHGYQWSKREFLPALKALTRMSRVHDRVIAGIGYYVLGDVHDINEAPLAAIRAYRCSARLWPVNGAAWREIGNMHEEMGENEKALRMLRKAVPAHPRRMTLPSLTWGVLRNTPFAAPVILRLVIPTGGRPSFWPPPSISQVLEALAGNGCHEPTAFEPRSGLSLPRVGGGGRSGRDHAEYP